MQLSNEYIFKDDFMQCKELEFGTEKNKITITLLDEMMEQRLGGMVSSPLFMENIAIVVADSQDDNDFSYACLGCEKNGIAPRIAITEDLWRELKEETPVAKTTIMHEIGHYLNHDVGNNEDNSDERRFNLVRQNIVCQKEIKADLFAVQYLGKETVIAGLQELKQRTLVDFADCDEESVQLSVKEIEIRISLIKKYRNLA